MSRWTIARIGAASASLVLLGGAALAGPASAKHGSDDDGSSSGSGSSGSSGSGGSGSSGRGSGNDSSNNSDDGMRGGGDDGRKERLGSCSAASDWKLKAKARDGGLEVEFEVDSNVNGQRWVYGIRHDGTLKSSGMRTTTAPSGSFSVERRLPNASGVHTISAAASNVATGEICRASLRF